MKVRIGATLCVTLFATWAPALEVFDPVTDAAVGDFLGACLQKEFSFDWIVRAAETAAFQEAPTALAEGLRPPVPLDTYRAWIVPSYYDAGRPLFLAVARNDTDDIAICIAMFTHIDPLAFERALVAETGAKQIDEVRQYRDVQRTYALTDDEFPVFSLQLQEHDGASDVIASAIHDLRK